MLLSNATGISAVSAALFSCTLMATLPFTAHAEDLTKISDLPMGAVIEGQKADFDWFNERFGLTWNDLESNYSEGEVDAFLDRWRASFPDDPEAWISAANWNWKKSQQAMVFQADPQPGFFITEGTLDNVTTGMRRIDDQEGGQSSFMTEGVYTDSDRYEIALRLYSEGLQKFPYRVDLHEIVADFYLYFGKYNELIEYLTLLPSSLRNAGSQLEQANYQPLYGDTSEIISGIFHWVNMRLAEKGEAKSMETFLVSAQLMTRAVPDDPVAWTDLVGAQHNAGNKQGAYSAAQRAYELAPDDEIVVLNLATLSLELGLRSEAIELNNWLVQNASQPFIAERAHGELELMGVEPD